MTTLLAAPDAVQAVLLAGSLALAGVAVWKLAWPGAKWLGRKLFGDILAVFTGRPEHIDRLTGVKVEKVPSLVDALVQIRDKQDEQGADIKALTTVVTQVADQGQRIAELAGRTEVLEGSVAALLADRWEAGAAATLAAVEKRNEKEGT